MVYSYVTHSKQGNTFYLVFENDMEPEKYLKVTFVPYSMHMVLGAEYIDIHHIKLRDPEVILLHLESFGLTLVTEGL